MLSRDHVRLNVHARPTAGGSKRHRSPRLVRDLTPLDLALKGRAIALRLADVGGSGAKRIGRGARAEDAASWTLTTGAASGTLLLRFVGPTPTHEIPDFIAALTQNLPTRPAHIVFDLRQLEGHNLETRAPMQRWLMANRPRIAKVTVVVKKAATILKMATSVVGLAAGMKIEIRDDLESDASVHHL